MTGNIKRLLGIYIWTVIYLSAGSALPSENENKYVFISMDEIFVPIVLKPKLQYEEKTTVTTIDGKRITIYKTKQGLVVEGHVGKIVLLEMFGYTCPHCIAAIPGYNEFKTKYPDDVYIITVDIYGASNQRLKSFAQSNGVTYDTVAKSNAGKIIQYFETLTGWTVPLGVPALLVLGRDGAPVKYYYPQDLPKDQVESLIRSLL